MDKQQFGDLAIIFLALALAFEAARIVRRLKKIERSKTDLWLGVGLYVSVLACLTSFLWPITASWYAAADNTARKSKMKEWHRAIMMYAVDNDEHLPLLKNWEQEARAYLPDGESATLRDPVTNLEKGIGYNAAIAGRSLAECDEDIVILISGKNAPAIEHGIAIVDDFSAVVINLNGWVTGMRNPDLVWALPDPSPHNKVNDQSPDPATDQQ